MPQIKATIFAEDSFGKRNRGFEKELETGDFEQFFSQEGEYLDRLATTLAEHGGIGDQFNVQFKVTVVKES